MVEEHVCRAMGTRLFESFMVRSYCGVCVCVCVCVCVYICIYSLHNNMGTAYIYVYVN